MLTGSPSNTPRVTSFSALAVGGCSICCTHAAAAARRSSWRYFFESVCADHSKVTRCRVYLSSVGRPPATSSSYTTLQDSTHRSVTVQRRPEGLVVRL